MTHDKSNLVTATRLCEQFNINRRTLDRWMKDLKLKFPEPIVINGRLYFNQRDINLWNESQGKATSVPSEVSYPGLDKPHTVIAKALGFGRPLTSTQLAIVRHLGAQPGIHMNAEQSKVGM